MDLFVLTEESRERLPPVKPNHQIIPIGFKAKKRNVVDLMPDMDVDLGLVKDITMWTIAIFKGALDLSDHVKRCLICTFLVHKYSEGTVILVDMTELKGSGYKV